MDGEVADREGHADRGDTGRDFGELRAKRRAEAMLGEDVVVGPRNET